MNYLDPILVDLTVSPDYDMRLIRDHFAAEEDAQSALVAAQELAHDVLSDNLTNLSWMLDWNISERVRGSHSNVRAIIPYKDIERTPRNQALWRDFAQSCHAFAATLCSYRYLEPFLVENLKEIAEERSEADRAARERSAEYSAAAR